MSRTKAMGTCGDAMSGRREVIVVGGGQAGPVLAKRTSGQLLEPVSPRPTSALICGRAVAVRGGGLDAASAGGLAGRRCLGLR
jgi:hypothetical protein